MVPPKKNRGGGRGRGTRGGGGRGRGTGRGPGRPPAPRAGPSPASQSQVDPSSTSASLPPTEVAPASALTPDTSSQSNTVSQGDQDSPVSVSESNPLPSTSSSRSDSDLSSVEKNSSQPPLKFGKLIAPEHQINWAKGVWYNFGYFEKCDEGKYARCMVCSKKASKTLTPIPEVGPEKQPLGIVEIPGASTSKVQHHFYSHHTEYLGEFLEYKLLSETKREERQGAKRKLLGGSDSSGKRQAKLVVSNKNDLALDVKLDPEFQRVWDSALCDFVAETQCSFSMVASDAFKKLIGLLLRKGRYSRLPQFKLKSRQQITRDIEKYSKELSGGIMDILEFFKADMSSIAYSTDCWTSKSNDSFCSLTLTFLTEKNEWIRLVPFEKHFPTRHTGRNIRLAIDKMIQKLKLPPGITQYIIHDNASNAVAAFKAHEGMKQLFCLNHTINLMVGDGMKMKVTGALRDDTTVKEVLDKTQTLAKKIKRSPLLKAEVKQVCAEKGVKFISPKLWQQTRWHSKLGNISSLMRIKPVLNHLFDESNEEVWAELEISKVEWKVLSGVQTCLEKVQVTSRSLESDTSPTAHLVVTKLFELEHSLIKFMTTLSNDR